MYHLLITEITVVVDQLCEKCYENRSNFLSQQTMLMLRGGIAVSFAISNSTRLGRSIETFFWEVNKTIVTLIARICDSISAWIQEKSLEQLRRSS